MTLIEVMFAAALSVLVGFVLHSVYRSSQEGALRVQRQTQAASVVKEWDRMIVRYLANISAMQFDPELTFVPTDATRSNFQVAAVIGGPWHMGRAAHERFTKSQVASYSVGSFQSPMSSHDLPLIKLSMNDTSGSLGMDSDKILMSRCIDPKEGVPKTHAELQALRRPFVVDGQIQCCLIKQQTIAGVQTFRHTDCESPLEYWPTVVIYSGEDRITTIPSESDRELVPGVGFFMTFNQNEYRASTDTLLPPSRFVMYSFGWRNRCQINVGKKCAKSRLDYATSDRIRDGVDLFHRDIEAGKVMEFAGELARPISGKGSVVFGTRNVGSSQ